MIKINKKDHASLEAFWEKAEELNKFQYLRRNGSRNFTLKFNQEDGLSASQNLPTDEEIYAAVAVFRPIYLKQENVHFLTINKKLRNISTKLENQKFVAFLDNCKRRYLAELNENCISFKVNGMDISPQETLDAYFYGKYAKVQHEKRDFLDLFIGPSALLHKHRFITILDQLIFCTISTASVYLALKSQIGIQTHQNQEK